MFIGIFELFINCGLVYRYEDGESILRKVASAADFIWSENPLEILGTVTCISFDDQASLPLKEHDLTTEEVLFSLISHTKLIKD